uniref:Protein NRT1/ PTR FAMILY 5.10 n=1 Tax=Zea mays TaxID=4577 RepID=A0A804Q092_MAIZE
MPSRSDSDSLLVRAEGMRDAALDYHGRPADRGATGGWRSALFIIAVEIAERFTFYGVSANLINYLTGPLGQGTAAAAAAINAWNGVAQLLPLLGGALADKWLGRYRTIVIASLLYILGGHKPCVQAFGADQFDQTDPKETVSRSSFFNWWYFGMCAGTAVTLVLLSYVQDNIGWGLGFGIPCAVMAAALAVFLLGTRTYRYYVTAGQGLFARAGEAFAEWRSRRKAGQLVQDSQELDPPAADAPRFSAGVDVEEQAAVRNNGGLVKEAKAIIRLFPIWAACLLYAVAYSQSSTFFTKQAATLDRRIGRHVQVPPAALQSFISVTIVVIIPIYDRVLVPVSRRYSGKPSGITMLQRIGTGMFLSLLSMVIAALVEKHRLRVAGDAGLVDKPKVPVPMSLWWMVPQYVLFGAADVFTMVGLQEFFYDQVPDKLRSLGLALYLSIFGVGSFISSALVSVIDRVTTDRGGSWFSNNLNRGHVDYFYWLLAALSAVELLAYVFFAVTYKYKNRGAVHATVDG